MNYEIKIKRLSNDAIIPERKTEGAIAFDLSIPRDTLVMPGRSVIPLDFAIELPLGYEAKIEPRSGYSLKGMEGRSVKRIDSTPGRHRDINAYQILEGEHRANCDVIQGKIDSDYRGNVGVIIHNCDFTFVIPKGTCIAQMTIYHSSPEWYFAEVTDLSETERAEGGYGHTNKKQ